MYTTPWRDKEVVVNALTLICQEFCRTRTCGETREERQLEEPLSHTTLWKACYTHAHAHTHTIHVRYTCTRQPDNAFRTVSRSGSTSCQNCLIVCRFTNSSKWHKFSFARSMIFKRIRWKDFSRRKWILESFSFFFLNCLLSKSNFEKWRIGSFLKNVRISINWFLCFFV